MTRPHSLWRKAKSWWLSGWPFWALLIFASLAAVRLLPGGYIRAVMATPILLMVPGSLTLSAVFSEYHRPRGAVFVCYSALLSVVWSAFASLALYVLTVLITAGSTYWCLLVISAVLAIVAETRILLGRSGKRRRVVYSPESIDPGLSDAEADDAEAPMAARAGRYYAIVAVVAGGCLLAGGAYALDHLPQPAPTGYTWMAWAGPQVKGDMPIGSKGTELPFQIVHRQSGTTTFQLKAAWLSTPSRLLATPMTLSLGPNRTFHGALFIPPLPSGCTYRIVVTLTAAQQIDPMTRQPQTWSINADVHESGRSRKACQ